MLRLRYSTCLLLGISTAVVVLAAAPAPQGKGKGTQPPKVSNEIIQEFPTNGDMETAWKVTWATTRGYGVYIQDAWFKRGPNEPWMQVLGDARCAEIFVPYHRGSPRFWDISYNFPLCTVTKEDAGAFGKLVGKGAGQTHTVVQEVRDRGLIFKDTNNTRRGQKLLVWGTLQAANYRYVIEYGFQDDGTVTFRMGATGYNYGGSEFEPHMHNGLWRIDVNLDGPDNNSVYLVEHLEPDPANKIKAKTILTPFNGGKEGFADFDANKFTSVRVVHTTKKNKRGEPWAYDLMPLRCGNGRHHGGEREVCTHHDYWVTRAKPTEIIYNNVPKFVADKEDIMNTDVVLWYSAPMHHEPRSEDGEMVNNRISGTTHVAWAGFELRPRNIFDRTPLYPYKR